MIYKKHQSVKSGLIFYLFTFLIITICCFCNMNYCNATSVVYTYDRLGRIKTVTDATGNREFKYDSVLQPESETIAGLYNVVTMHNYDNYGRNAGFSLEGEDYSVTYGYEKGTGRFNSVEWNIGNFSGSLTYSYIPKSDIIHQLKTGKFVITYSYEPHRDLRIQVRNERGTDMISQYDYNYDALGRKTSVINTGQAFVQPTFNIYKYNDRSELIKAEGYIGTDINNTDNPIHAEYRTYDYDNIGNRTKSEANNKTAIYNANSLNQYKQIKEQNGIKNFNFDADGNLSSVHDSLFETLYSYNDENRLITVKPANPSDGDKKVEFLYDYMGRRIRKRVYIRNVGNWELLTEKLFLYYGWNMIRETTLTDGKIFTKSYIWGLDVSQSLQGAGGIGGLIAVIDHSSSEIYYFLHDGNGNVGQLVDSDGKIVAKYEYDPYGNILIAGGSKADSNPFRFNTKYYDWETRLYYCRYRYYMPQVGRWLNKDPINELGNVVLRLAGSPFGAETVPQYNWHAHKGISTIWRTKICQTSPARRYPRKKLYSAFPRKAWGQGDFSMTPPTCGYTHAYNRSVDINPYGYVWNDPVNRSDSNGLAPIGSDGNIAPGHFNETGSWIPEPQSQIPQPPQPPEFDALDATELSLMAILPEVMIPIMIGTSCVRNTCGKFAVQAAGNLRRLGLKCINLAGKSYNSGRKALEKRGFVLNRTTKTGRKIFVHPEKGTIITYDSGKALGAGQKPHWTIQDRGGQYYNRCGRPVSGPNPPMGGKHIPGSD